MQAQVAGKVEHFDGFLVEDGELVGRVGDDRYTIKHILALGEGKTYVVYYDDDEEIEILHSDKKGYVNRRVYG